jgi:hypothetical protein
MEMIFCPNCNKLTGYKRVIGFGTLFAVLLTAGLWLLTLPFYPQRCITCGLRKSDSVPWYRTWRLAFVMVIAVAAVGAILNMFFPNYASKVSSIELLGFQQNTKDAGVHATALGFRLKGCEVKGDGFRYCNYVQARDETLSLIFWREELETVEYNFGIGRYDRLLKELSSKYGSPKTVYVQGDPTTKLSDGWGSVPEGAYLSVIERADHTGGVATLDFHGGKFDEHMKTAFPHYQRPPDIASQALPEVKKAEQRLFGERTAEVDRLEVISETQQGNFAVTTHCKAHACPDHYAVWTLDLSTGEAAGALADESEILVYLGDYGSPEKLPAVLRSEIEEQRGEGLSSPKHVRYVSQVQ